MFLTWSSSQTKKKFNFRKSFWEVLPDKVFNTANNPQYDGYQGRFDSIVHKFSDEKSLGGGIKLDVTPNQKLADQLHKTIIEKCKSIKHIYNFSWQHKTYIFSFFLSFWVFVHEHSRIAGLQGKGEGISLTPPYYFNPLCRHLDINLVITVESSPLHIAMTQIENLWFTSASC